MDLSFVKTPKSLQKLDTIVGSTGSTFYTVAKKDNIKVGLRFFADPPHIGFRIRIFFEGDTLVGKDTEQVVGMIREKFSHFPSDFQFQGASESHVSFVPAFDVVLPGDIGPKDTFKRFEKGEGPEKTKKALMFFKGGRTVNTDTLVDFIYKTYRNQIIAKVEQDLKNKEISDKNIKGQGKAKLFPKEEKDKAIQEFKDAGEGDGEEEESTGGAVVQFPGASMYLAGGDEEEEEAGEATSGEEDIEQAFHEESDDEGETETEAAEDTPDETEQEETET